MGCECFQRLLASTECSVGCQRYYCLSRCRSGFSPRLIPTTLFWYSCFFTPVNAKLNIVAICLVVLPSLNLEQFQVVEGHTAPCNLKTTPASKTSPWMWWSLSVWQLPSGRVLYSTGWVCPMSWETLCFPCHLLKLSKNREIAVHALQYEPCLCHWVAFPACPLNSVSLVPSNTCLSLYFPTYCPSSTVAWITELEQFLNGLLSRVLILPLLTPPHSCFQYQHAYAVSLEGKHSTAENEINIWLKGV